MTTTPFYRSCGLRQPGLATLFNHFFGVFATFPSNFAVLGPFSSFDRKLGNGNVLLPLTTGFATYEILSFDRKLGNTYFVLEI